MPGACLVQSKSTWGLALYNAKPHGASLQQWGCSGLLHSHMLKRFQLGVALWLQVTGKHSLVISSHTDVLHTLCYALLLHTGSMGNPCALPWSTPPQEKL